MNKTALLITLLAGLATGASAAVIPANRAILVLPTYVVTAPKNLPAERLIAQQRDEFVRQTLAPRAILPESPRFQIPADSVVRLSTVTHAKRSAAKSRS